MSVTHVQKKQKFFTHHQEPAATQQRLNNEIEMVYNHYSNNCNHFMGVFWDATFFPQLLGPFLGINDVTTLGMVSKDLRRIVVASGYSRSNNNDGVNIVWEKRKDTKIGYESIPAGHFFGHQYNEAFILREVTQIREFVFNVLAAAAAATDGSSSNIGSSCEENNNNFSPAIRKQRRLTINLTLENHVCLERDYNKRIEADNDVKDILIGVENHAETRLRVSIIEVEAAPLSREIATYGQQQQQEQQQQQHTHHEQQHEKRALFMFHPNDVALVGDYWCIRDYNIPKWTEQDKDDLRRVMNYIYTCVKRISKWQSQGDNDNDDGATSEYNYPSVESLMNNSLPKWLHPYFPEELHRRQQEGNASTTVVDDREEDTVNIIEFEYRPTPDLKSWEAMVPPLEEGIYSYSLNDLPWYNKNKNTDTNTDTNVDADDEDYIGSDVKMRDA